MIDRSLAAYGGIALASIAVDQYVKQLVETGLEMHEMVELVPYLALYRTYNTGIAFSMFAWVGDRGLMLLSLLVIGFVLYLAARSHPSQRLARFGFALIVGGAIGNLIDRGVYGHVIDYILFHTPVWSFAVFNLADAFISVGAAAVVLQEFLGRKPPDEPAP
jgi:signal peptidase II